MSQATSNIYTIGGQMTYDELLNVVNKYSNTRSLIDSIAWKSLLAIVELHKPIEDSPYCENCCRMGVEYPCSTIQVIEKELN